MGVPSGVAVLRAARQLARAPPRSMSPSAGSRLRPLIRPCGRRRRCLRRRARGARSPRRSVPRGRRHARSRAGRRGHARTESPRRLAGQTPRGVACGRGAPSRTRVRRRGAGRQPARSTRGPRRCRYPAAARAGVAQAANARRERERAMASEAVRAKAGEIASGGVSISPLVPVPWRSGTITASRADATAHRRSRAAGAERSCSSRGSSAGQSPGTRAPAHTPATARARSQADRRALAILDGVGQHEHPARCRRRDHDRSLVTTIVRSIASHCVQRVSTSPTIARTTCARSCPAMLDAGAALPAQALDRKDRGGAHQPARVSASSSVCDRELAARRRAAHPGVAVARADSLDGLVGDDRIDQRAVVVEPRRPRRPWLPPS